METAHRLRTFLVPFSWIYGTVVAVRNACYDSGIFKIIQIGTPVISIGNITTGGTGKTPLVEYLAAWMRAHGKKPAVLSRGYGRDTSGTLVVSDGLTVRENPLRGGDEPVQIARKIPGCPVVVDEDRVRGARFIESTFSPDVILLDDGFQHRALHRDLDIVILDDDLNASEMPLLPAGNRRESMKAMERAGLVIVHVRKGSPPGGGTPPRFTRITMRHRLKRIIDPVTGGEVSPESLRGTVCVAFCGIGNPGAFRRTLLESGIVPADFLEFPDHHRFTERDISRIDDCRGKNGARYVVTTEKDAVRLDAASRIPAGLLVIEIGVIIEEGADHLESALAAVGKAA